MLLKKVNYNIAIQVYKCINGLSSQCLENILLRIVMKFTAIARDLLIICSYIADQLITKAFHQEVLMCGTISLQTFA